MGTQLCLIRIFKSLISQFLTRPALSSAPCDCPDGVQSLDPEVQCCLTEVGNGPKVQSESDPNVFRNRLYGSIGPRRVRKCAPFMLGSQAGSGKLRRISDTEVTGFPTIPTDVSHNRLYASIDPRRVRNVRHLC